MLDILNNVHFVLIAMVINTTRGGSDDGGGLISLTGVDEGISPGGCWICASSAFISDSIAPSGSSAIVPTPGTGGGAGDGSKVSTVRTRAGSDDGGGHDNKVDGRKWMRR